MDLDDLAQIINTPLSQAEEGDYACLADENDEQGQVNVYRKSGTLVMTMPREVWDQLREKQS